ncbi:MAG: acyl-CoA thioesterase [Deltaproteobacteria bacterium]|nr:acyl-CoA thioesterase [Deltaproteobacteria bacterium]
MRPKPFIPEPFGNDDRYVRDKTGGLIWHRCRTRTLYADTDRSQTVYHANYLRFFEFGRASLMRDSAYPYREIEESGYIYPIIEIGLKYHRPLGYDDPIWIHTHPAKLERVRLRFDYIITHEETGEIICVGFTRHCAINLSGTPVAVDEKTCHLWKTFPK